MGINATRGGLEKCHTIVGAETNIVMHVRFSTKGVHDIRDLKPLVETAQNKYSLHRMAMGTRNQSGHPREETLESEDEKDNVGAFRELVDWYDDRQRSFS